MTWFVHATRQWTDGQVAVAIFFILTGVAMVADMLRRRLMRLRASVRRHPANRPPYDWAKDTRCRQAATVQRLDRRAS